MGKEIERKFLVNKKIWNYEGQAKHLVQGYLLSDTLATVRVRIAENQAFLTIKSNTNRLSRDEYEYEIPIEDAQNMLKLCKDFPVAKTRWTLTFEGKIWEVDVFEGDNEGLVMAEIELEYETEPFVLPPWIDQEVSQDVRFYNSFLSKHPYRIWSQLEQ
jgi:adenylate cyclase